MPMQIEMLYEFDVFQIFVERNTVAGTVELVWWYDEEKDADGNRFDVWLKITTTDDRIEALKAGRITCRAFWLANEGLTLHRDHEGLGGPQINSVTFAEVESRCPREGHYLYQEHQPELR